MPAGATWKYAFGVRSSAAGTEQRHWVRTEARRLVGAPRTLSVVGPVDEDSFDVGALGLG